MSVTKIKNMEEFAALCGISRPTASKFFHDPSSVRVSTRRKIEAALEQHDYRPNFYAINQNRDRTKTMGLVVPNLTDPFFAGIARMIEGLIVKAGYNPVLLSSHAGPDQEVANLGSLRGIKPAGLLFAPLGRASRVDAVKAFCADVPTVLFDANLDGVGEAFYGSDNDQSVGLIVDYLCRSGTAPAFFEMRDPVNPNAFRRRRAFAAAMQRLGHEAHMIQVDGTGWDFEEIGFREGMRMFARGQPPARTILCSNDRLAIGLLSAAFESGLKVGIGEGCDIRIAGHDDHPFARYTCPGLTTISQDYSAIATRSVEAIVRMIDGTNAQAGREVALFDGHLVLRGSA